MSAPIKLTRAQATKVRAARMAFCGCSLCWWALHPAASFSEHDSRIAETERRNAGDGWEQCKAHTLSVEDALAPRRPVKRAVPVVAFLPPAPPAPVDPGVVSRQWFKGSTTMMRAVSAEMTWAEIEADRRSRGLEVSHG